MREARRAPGANRSVWRYHSQCRYSAMALALGSLLEDDRLRADYRSSARVHLARHTRSEVARSYLRVLESAARFASRATHADQSLHE